MTQFLPSHSMNIHVLLLGIVRFGVGAVPTQSIEEPLAASLVKGVALLKASGYKPGKNQIQGLYAKSAYLLSTFPLPCYLFSIQWDSNKMFRY